VFSGIFLLLFSLLVAGQQRAGSSSNWTFFRGGGGGILMVNKVSIEKKERKRKRKKNLEIVVTLMSRAGRHLFLRCRSSASLMLGSSTVYIYIGKTECVCAGHLFYFLRFSSLFYNWTRRCWPAGRLGKRDDSRMTKMVKDSAD
jgi:hypothetical protein